MHGPTVFALSSTIMGPEANITIMTKQREEEGSTDGADDGGLAGV